MSDLVFSPVTRLFRRKVGGYGGPIDDPDQVPVEAIGAEFLES